MRAHDLSKSFIREKRRRRLPSCLNVILKNMDINTSSFMDENIKNQQQTSFGMEEYIPALE